MLGSLDILLPALHRKAPRKNCTGDSDGTIIGKRLDIRQIYLALGHKKRTWSKVLSSLSQQGQVRIRSMPLSLSTNLVGRWLKLLSTQTSSLSNAPAFKSIPHLVS